MKTQTTAKQVETGILKAAWRIFTILVVVALVVIVLDLVLGTRVIS